ncbi:MAG: hypothetical protein ACP5I2_03965 [Fervidicoccaceae archaeon]
MKLAREEPLLSLEYRVSKERYRNVLKFLAQGIGDWRRLKIKLEDIEGRSLSNRVLHDILHIFGRHPLIDEDNKFLDPIIEEAAKTL